MVGVTLAQRDQEPRHGRLGDLAQALHALAVEVLEVAAQVAAVGRERVDRETALDREVVEVGAYGARELAGRGGRGRRPGVYASTSSGLTASMPTPSPTGLLVSWPACVLRPSRRLWSSRQACSQPLVASATAYGMVALVSA